MLKKGFTLAEVLITLGIVGVIAAITLPNLSNNITASQIGPKLAKAASAFEQANKSFLDSQDVDAITESEAFISTWGSPRRYGWLLSNFLNMTEMFSGNLFNYYSSGVYYLAKDGIVYQFDNMYLDDDDADLPPHKQKIGYIYIHINGMQGHSLDGEDRFYFTLFNDGSLKPKGAQGWGGEKTWRTECPAGGIPDDYSYCAGHIFENNLKVLYK